MKIRLLILSLLLAGVCTAQEQNKPFTLYEPAADAHAAIDKAVMEAHAAGKHVLVEAGGNWCKWCRIFYYWSSDNHKVDSLLQAGYITVHLNYSKENKNPAVMKQLGYPQRFGFPVFIVLDGEGNRIHTQNSGYLEDGEGYSEAKVSEFLEQWMPSALDPKKYE